MPTEFFHYAIFALFPVALAYAAISDLLTLTIPNRLVLAMVGLFVVLAPFSGMGWGGFGLHMLAGALLLVIGFILFAFGWIGGGDAKLAAAIALFLGLNNALVFVALASIIGGGLTLALLAFRRAPVPAVIIRQPWAQRLHSATGGVPYGVALAIAAAIIYPHTIWAGIALG
jgi:prepilin peptidase CpaA